MTLPVPESGQDSAQEADPMQKDTCVCSSAETRSQQEETQKMGQNRQRTIQAG